jgi:Holliday junction resolvase RusA-like endonuclease
MWWCRVTPCPQAIVVSFIVPGRVGGKQRVGRDFRKGLHHTFNPRKTESQEGVIRHYGHQAMVQARQPLLRGALRLHVEVWRNYPKSWSAKKCSVHTYVTGKPDWDNTAKLIGDALNGICYSDDSQIADGRLVRRYRLDDTECIHITLEELDTVFEPPRQKRRHMLGAS